MTLKEKLKKIPSPIREMMVENAKHQNPKTWKKIMNDRYNIYNIGLCFWWAYAKNIPDYNFWSGVFEEIYIMDVMIEIEKIMLSTKKIKR